MKGLGSVAHRSASLKTPMKEKFVSIYEDIFKGKSAIQTTKNADTFVARQQMQRFWDELFLLKVGFIKCGVFCVKAVAVTSSIVRYRWM